jgi:hypothetical protein
MISHLVLTYDSIPPLFMVSVPVSAINLMVVPAGTLCCIPNVDGAAPNVDGATPNVDGAAPNVDGATPNVDGGVLNAFALEGWRKAAVAVDVGDPKRPVLCSVVCCAPNPVARGLTKSLFPLFSFADHCACSCFAPDPIQIDGLSPMFS